MAVSYNMGGYGGGVMMGGGGGPGEGMSNPIGIIATLQGILSFMPAWLANLVIALVFLLSMALAGYIVGQIIGRIQYPNPDKQSLLNKNQKFACLGAVILAFALTIFALGYEPKPETEIGTTSPVGGQLDENGSSAPTDGNTVDEAAPADGASSESSSSSAEVAPEAKPQIAPPVAAMRETKM